VIDTPISEAAIVGAACGAALLGMRPIAEFQFIDFISAGFDMPDQLRRQVPLSLGRRCGGCVSRSLRLRLALGSFSFSQCRVFLS